MTEQKTNYLLQPDGTFTIENYNKAPAFSSFFPGIAGLNGIPLWAYYVNRGQGISTFGIKNKNYAIMEFYPANTAYSLVSTFGFRTFLKIKKSGKTINYESFKINPDYPVKQTMFITSSDMSIEEINTKLGVKISVRYATLPNEPIAALIRIVRIENISKSNMDISIVDGMPKLIPYFISQWSQKFMSATIQAWTTVDNFSKTGNPFFRLKVDTQDNAEVVEIKEGNFYFGYSGDEKKVEKTDVIIDPQVLFGSDLSFSTPQNFYSDKNFKAPKSQFADNKYPCAFSFSSVKLAPKKSASIYSMVGHIDSTASLNSLVKKAASAKYFENKIADNKKLIKSITDNMHTKSALNTFDKYCRQTYLDNVMRGGYPIIFKDGDKSVPYYVYSRKHGDLERDYNEFQVSPNYYSQGNGNFRDVNQNRRKDVFFNPKIQAVAVKIFYNLIQIDGNNPLVVKGSYYVIDSTADYYVDIENQITLDEHKQKLKNFFSKGFEPGQLAMFVDKEKIKLKIKAEYFIAKCVVNSQVVNDADFGEGFWVDHWTYNLDLLESYLAIYPENEKEIFFEDKSFGYYDCDHYVVPRANKCVLTEKKVRRYGSVVKCNEKAALIKSRKVNPNALRTQNGKGEVYFNSLASKFLTIVSVKLASLDPDGIGIEMESDKPGWYDSLNGLPGIFGSSTCETFELKRCILYFKEVLEKNPSQQISIPIETAEFFEKTKTLLHSEELSDFDFWDKSTSLKESYRSKIIMGIDGAEKTFAAEEILDFLNLAIKKINAGLKKAVDVKTGLYYTYFRFEAVKYKEINFKNAKGFQCVEIQEFKRFPLPLFLEGEVHYLKTEENKEIVLKHIKSMKNSQIYDKKLGMFKVNAPLKTESLEIGRTRVFLPGWLENESVFMHMAYKYLLEILKSGLYDEFFNEIKTGFVCFTDPKVYGRSILENSSFICSSAFPDVSNAGRGFVARLSGSAAEFIDMWLRMTIGNKPFSYENGELKFTFNPVINSKFFDKNGEFSFKLFCHTDVTYINPSKKSTYQDGIAIKKIEIEWNDGKKETFENGIISGSPAQMIRDVLAKEIKVFYNFSK